MDVATLSPSPAELHLDGFEVEACSITIQIAAKRPLACCPSCGEFSERIHSRYTRTLSDLPWHGVPVRIRLHTRRFFCDTPVCERRIFTERLPQTVQPYGRKTRRLENTLQLLGLFLGGEAGARLFITASGYGDCRGETQAVESGSLKLHGSSSHLCSAARTFAAPQIA